MNSFINKACSIYYETWLNDVKSINFNTITQCVRMFALGLFERCLQKILEAFNLCKYICWPV